MEGLLCSHFGYNGAGSCLSGPRTLFPANKMYRRSGWCRSSALGWGGRMDRVQRLEQNGARGENSQSSASGSAWGVKWLPAISWCPTALLALKLLASASILRLLLFHLMGVYSTPATEHQRGRARCAAKAGLRRLTQVISAEVAQSQKPPELQHPKSLSLLRN